jgi:hypothetical protein
MGRMASEVNQDKNSRSYLKNNYSNIGLGGLGQGVECLPNKCKVLSSNPSINKKERRKRGREGGNESEREGR